MYLTVKLELYDILIGGQKIATEDKTIFLELSELGLDIYHAYDEIIVRFTPDALIPLKVLCNKFANRRLRLSKMKMPVRFVYARKPSFITETTYWLSPSIRKIEKQNHIGIFLEIPAEIVLTDGRDKERLYINPTAEILLSEFNCAAIDLLLSPKKLEQYAR